jgi:hypothetical protein
MHKGQAYRTALAAAALQSLHGWQDAIPSHPAGPLVFAIFDARFLPALPRARAVGQRSLIVDTQTGATRRALPGEVADMVRKLAACPIDRNALRAALRRRSAWGVLMEGKRHE